MVSSQIPPNGSYTTVCRTIGWWSVVPINKSAVINLLDFPARNNKLSLSPVPPPYSSQIASYQHPVVFEMQYEADCVNNDAPHIKSTIKEFILATPYVSHPDYPNTTFTYKRLIYLSSQVAVDASIITYGLPTYLADESVTENVNDLMGAYNVTYDNSSLYTNYDSTNYDNWTKINAMGDKFNFFKDINNAPWLCTNKIETETLCAYTLRDFDNDNALARAATMDLKWDSDDVVLPYLASDNHIRTVGFTDNIFGTTQLNVTLYVTPTMKCP